jgi:hypothetical protein
MAITTFNEFYAVMRRIDELDFRLLLTELNAEETTRYEAERVKLAHEVSEFTDSL